MTSRGVVLLVPSPLEEPPCTGAVAPRRSEHVDDLPCLVDRAVDIPPAAGDLRVGLVDLPAIANLVPAGPGGLSQQRREPHDPAVDSDLVDLDPALGEELFDVAVGQPKA